MKKNSLLLTIMFIFCAIIGQAKEKVTKKNGGKNGYRDITEKHNGDNHSLKCAEPGNESCTWNQGTSHASPQELIAIDTFIENQLSLGNYNGSGNLSNTNIWFYWLYTEGSGELNYTIAEDEPDYVLLSL